MMDKVSVVIPTLNGGERFGEVLAGIFAQAHAVGEVVVVDSESTDGTVERAKAAGAKVLQIERAAFNHGLTRDLGIHASSGDFVVLLSQDAVPGDGEMVGRLLGAFTYSDVAGVSGRQVARSDADVLTKRRLGRAEVTSGSGWVHRINDWQAYEAMTPMERYQFCRFDNVCSVIRRSAWEKQRFGECPFGEDILWAKRILESGGAIAYEPAAWVEHSHEETVRGLYERTYLDHRMLRGTFGLQTVPTRGRMMRAVVGGMMRDMAYVSMREPGLMMKVPGLTWASVAAQYRAARDGES